MNAINLQAGDRVQGLYYGVAFAGTVTSNRPSCANGDETRIGVVLDAKIDLPELQDYRREALVVTVLEDGTSRKGRTRIELA